MKKDITFDLYGFSAYADIISEYEEGFSLGSWKRFHSNNIPRTLGLLINVEQYFRLLTWETRLRKHFRRWDLHHLCSSSKNKKTFFCFFSGTMEISRNWDSCCIMLCPLYIFLDCSLSHWVRLY